MSIEYSNIYGQYELFINGCLHSRHFTRSEARTEWINYKRNLRYGR